MIRTTSSLARFTFVPVLLGSLLPNRCLSFRQTDLYCDIEKGTEGSKSLKDELTVIDHAHEGEMRPQASGQGRLDYAEVAGMLASNRGLQDPLASETNRQVGFALNLVKSNSSMGQRPYFKEALESVKKIAEAQGKTAFGVKLPIQILWIGGQELIKKADRFSSTVDKDVPKRFEAQLYQVMQQSSSETMKLSQLRQLYEVAIQAMRANLHAEDARRNPQAVNELTEAQRLQKQKQIDTLAKLRPGLLPDAKPKKTKFAVGDSVQLCTTSASNTGSGPCKLDEDSRVLMKNGDVGKVVQVHEGSKPFEVEFNGRKWFYSGRALMRA